MSVCLKLALHHILYLDIVLWVLIVCIFSWEKEPVVSDNGAFGQASQILRERRGLCSRLVIKHDLVSSSSVMLSLIFDDALYFSFCAPFHLFKWCNVIGRPSITMTDGFPGGHLAVAKILGVLGGQYTFPATADVKWCNALSRVQRACFSAYGAGWSSGDAGLCLQHLSDLLVIIVQRREEHAHTDAWHRWGDSCTTVSRPFMQEGVQKCQMHICSLWSVI